MKWKWSLLALALLRSPSPAQESPPHVPPLTTAPAWCPAEGRGVEMGTGPVPAPDSAEGGGFLTGNRNFPNFIGFMSNPLQSIDPRSLTQVVPLFMGSWVSPEGRLPGADTQVYGPAMSFALSDRLAVGLNQGGYANAHFSGNGPATRFGYLLRNALANRGVTRGGDRTGFLNLGGFAQYTLVQDVPDQYLLTAGMRVTVPCGSTEIFQGHGPALLAPYLTAGKEFGQFHVLATAGYQFPARSGERSTELFYLNAHLDRQVCGWVYPLVELNWTYHTSAVDLGGLNTRHGYIDFGTFENTGNILTVAAGANCVLVRDRLEFGAVYSTPIASQNKFDFNGLLVRMVLRY